LVLQPLELRVSVHALLTQNGDLFVEARAVLQQVPLALVQERKETLVVRLL